MHFPFRISQCCFPFSVGRMDLKILKIFCIRMAAIRTESWLQHHLWSRLEQNHGYRTTYGRGQNKTPTITPWKIPMAAIRTKPRLQNHLWSRPEQNPDYNTLEHPYGRGQNKTPATEQPMVVTRTKPRL